MLCGQILVPLEDTEDMVISLPVPARGELMNDARADSDRRGDLPRHVWLPCARSSIGSCPTPASANMSNWPALGATCSVQ